MKPSLLGLLAATTLLAGTVHAAEPADAASNRVASYQREVRLSLVRHGWRVTQDEAGKITALRPWSRHNGTDQAVLNAELNSYARLQIDFRADGKAHVVAPARASLCYYAVFSPNNVGDTLYPPFALRDPELNREYREILQEADSLSTTDGRAYAAASRASSKVATK